MCCKIFTSPYLFVVSIPPAFDFDAWMKRHYIDEAVQEMKEVKHRRVHREMESEALPRENVVFGVLLSVVAVVFYTLFASEVDMKNNKLQHSYDEKTG